MRDKATNHSRHKRGVPQNPHLSAERRSVLEDRDLLEERDPSLINLPFPLPSIPILTPLLSPLISGSNGKSSSSSVSSAAATSTATSSASGGQPSSGGSSGGSPSGGSSGTGSSGSSSGGTSSGSTGSSGGSGSSSSGSSSGSSGSGSSSGTSGSRSPGTSSGTSGGSSNSSGGSSGGSSGDPSDGDSSGANPGSASVAAGGAISPTSAASDARSNAPGASASGASASGVSASTGTSTSISLSQETLINVVGVFSSGVSSTEIGTATPTVAGALATGSGSSSSSSGSKGSSSGSGSGGSQSGSGSSSGIGSSATGTTSSSSAHASGLPVGAIVAIVLGIVLVFICGAFFVLRRRRQQEKAKARNRWSTAGAGYGATEKHLSTVSSFVDRGVALAPAPGMLSSDPFVDPRSGMMAQIDHAPVLAAVPPAMVADRDPFSNAHRVSVASSSSSHSGEGLGEGYALLGTTGEQPRGTSPLSVRPFSPSEPFNFPAPPGSEWGSRHDISQSWQQEGAAAHRVSTPLSVSTDPFADSVEVGPVSDTWKLVHRAFAPSLADELLVRAGDRVKLLQAFDDGWVLVEKATNDLGEAAGGVVRGLIPVHCIRPSDAGEGGAQDGAEFLAGKRVSSYAHAYESLRLEDVYGGV